MANNLQYAAIFQAELDKAAKEQAGLQVGQLLVLGVGLGLGPLLRRQLGQTGLLLLLGGPGCLCLLDLGLQVSLGVGLALRLLLAALVGGGVALLASGGGLLAAEQAWWPILTRGCSIARSTPPRWPKISNFRSGGANTPHDPDNLNAFQRAFLL